MTVDEKTRFAQALAKATGLNLLVVTAWVNLENAGGGHAHNWLGLRPGVGKVKGKSGVALTTDAGGFAAFPSFEAGVTETAYWLNHLPQYAGIKKSASGSAGAQLTAIALSPWDAGHYTKGGKKGQSLFDSWKSVATQRLIGGGALSGVSGGVSTVTSAALGPVGAAAGAVSSWSDLLHPGRVVDRAVGDVLTRLLTALVALVLLVLAVLLFYQGVRRLSGDALPSASTLAAAGGRGASTGAALVAA